jgi:hypothetical protein
MASGGRFNGTAGIGCRGARAGAVGCYSCVRQVEAALARLGFPQCQRCRDERRLISGRHVMDRLDAATVEEWLGLAGSSRLPT